MFLKEPKYNRSFQFHHNTITALNFDSTFQTLLVGDVKGYLKAYRVSLYPKHIEFELIRSIKAHDSKINDITVNTNANTICTCSEDGFANIYNLYSRNHQDYIDAIIRAFHHPSNLPINFAHITTNPLYAIAFYSKENSTVYVYSINGQFLDSIIEKTGFIYNLSVLRATDSTECLVSALPHRFISTPRRNSSFGSCRSCGSSER
jgi:WD40 repeat protein